MNVGDRIVAMGGNNEKRQLAIHASKSVHYIEMC